MDFNFNFASLKNNSIAALNMSPKAPGNVCAADILLKELSKLFLLKL